MDGRRGEGGDSGLKIDFRELRELAAEDPTKILRDNAHELAFIEGKHISEVTIEEILDWFNSHYPWLQIRMASMPHQPPSAIKLVLIEKISSVMGQYWQHMYGKAVVEEDEEDDGGITSLH